MVSRKVPEEVLEIFDKYVVNNVRILSEEKSLELLQNEFNLTKEQAGQIFKTFDQDENGKMSVWEFQQFYSCVGINAQPWVQMFTDLDTDRSGYLDMEEAKQGIENFQAESNKNISDKEMMFFIKNAANENGLIDLGTFVALLSRLKAYANKLAQK